MRVAKCGSPRGCRAERSIAFRVLPRVRSLTRMLASLASAAPLLGLGIAAAYGHSASLHTRPPIASAARRAYLTEGMARYSRRGWEARTTAQGREAQGAPRSSGWEKRAERVARPYCPYATHYPIIGGACAALKT